MKYFSCAEYFSEAGPFQNVPVLQILWYNDAPPPPEKRRKNTEKKLQFSPGNTVAIPEGVVHYKMKNNVRVCAQTGEAKVMAELDKEQLKEVPFHPTPEAHTKLAEKTNMTLAPLPHCLHMQSAPRPGPSDPESWLLPKETANCLEPTPNETFSGLGSSSENKNV